MSRPASLLVAALVVTVAVAPAVTAAPTSTATPTPADATESAAASHVDASRADSLVDDHRALNAGVRHATAPNNTTTRLELPGERTGNYSTVGLDFGGTMAMSSEQVESEYRVELVTLQLERVDGQAARDAVVNAYLDAAVERLKNLSATERSAVRRYRRGAISAETLLVKLAIIDMRARAITGSISRIRSASGSLSTETEYRLSDVALELDGFTTSVRQHVAMAASGELKSEPNQLYVTASPDGVALEMLEDDRYYREAVRFDNRAPNAIDRFQGDLGGFQKRLEEIYPWSFSATQFDIDTYLDRNMYWVTFGHPQGSIETFIDGGTKDVYREQQSLILNRLPVEETYTKSTENLTVEVSTTPHGGPFEVNVTRTLPDAEGDPTTVPVDAVVKVNGRVVDATGDDGVVWMLAPVGDYDVTVEVGNTTTNVSVSP